MLLSPEIDLAARGRSASTAASSRPRGWLPLAAFLATTSLATAQTSETDPDVAHVAIISEDTAAGESLTLRVAITPGMPMIVVMSAPAAPDAVLAIPAVANADGEVAIGGVRRGDLPPEVLASGVLVRFATVDVASGAVHVSDPVTLAIPTETDATGDDDPSEPDDSSGASDPPDPSGAGAPTGAHGAGGPNPNDDSDDEGSEALSTPSGPNTGMLPPALRTSASVSSLGGLSVATIVFRNHNSRRVLSHDQPVPIQGSGH